MERRHFLALLATAVVVGCSSQDEKPKASGSPDGPRQAVEAYVDALNSRNVSALIAAGGVEDKAWSRQEAATMLAERGGRGWKIKDLRIEQDMGPDTGSARLLAVDAKGTPLKDTFTVTREGGDTWHLVVFTGQPNTPGKQPASTRFLHWSR
ncbi:hypothetical protein GA0115233_101257 [Streptomyces sp. DI166]|uniref:hypothetical protein n=1 Tax=Streptomyces sp. DI166 TaxID=1839783 RepID=UPI0007F4CE96|nr:hypothetical protein [Streptomyces sp. DI166]SBT89803.1 hypothetical protein GA0115233_101257 [Streptomyces sp. DI166]